MAYDTSYYDKQIKKYNTYADTVAQQQIGDAQKNAQSQLRQAYVQRMQNQQALEQNLAQAGIRGGMTESANLRLANMYGAQRGQINSDLSNSIQSINRSAEENKFNNQMSTESARQQYIENRGAEDRANAREDKIRKQEWAREDKQIAYERQQAKEQQAYERNTANYTAKYSKYFSEKDLKKALAKAKTPLERQIINARIGYVKSVKKGSKWT